MFILKCSGWHCLWNVSWLSSIRSKLYPTCVLLSKLNFCVPALCNLLSRPRPKLGRVTVTLTSLVLSRPRHVIQRKWVGYIHTWENVPKVSVHFSYVNLTLHYDSWLADILCRSAKYAKRNCETVMDIWWGTFPLPCTAGEVVVNTPSPTDVLMFIVFSPGWRPGVYLYIIKLVFIYFIYMLWLRPYVRTPQYSDTPHVPALIC